MNPVRTAFAGLSLITAMLSAPHFAYAASNCSAAKKAEILAAATSAQQNVQVNCSVTLSSSDTVTKHLIFVGNSSDDVTFNCNGGKISPTYSLDSYAINIKPKKLSYHNYERPENVTIKNCTVNGSIVLNTSNAPDTNDMGPVSIDLVRNSAPKNIVLDNLTITSSSRVPVYFHRGVTYSTLKNSTIHDNSGKTSIYLAAESGHNTVENNEFFVGKNGREVIAVDSSDHNKITRNWLTGLNNGGIYLYRNCGENGLVRYTTPSYNEISNNIFYYNKYTGSNPGVYIGSRNGNRSYCGDDQGWDWSYDGVPSSSTDDRDYARDNQVIDNQVCNRYPSDVFKVGYTVNTGNNIYSNSKIVCNSSTPLPRPVSGALNLSLIKEDIGNCSGGQPLYLFTAQASGAPTPYTFSWTNITTQYSGATDNPNEASLQTFIPKTVSVKVTASDGQSLTKSMYVSGSCSGTNL